MPRPEQNQSKPSAAQAKAKVQQTVWEPTEDAQGHMRTDRPLTPEEAAAIDAANREGYITARAKRFQQRRTGARR